MNSFSAYRGSAKRINCVTDHWWTELSFKPNFPKAFKRVSTWSTSAEDSKPYGMTMPYH